MSTMVRASMAISALLVVLVTSMPLHGQAAAVKAGPRGTAQTAARASSAAAVRVSRPPDVSPDPTPGKHFPHDRFRRSHLPFGYFPTFAGTRTVVVEPTVIYVDNTTVFSHEHQDMAAPAPAEDEYSSGTKRLAWKPGGITPVAPGDAPAAETDTQVRNVPVLQPLVMVGENGVLEGGPHFRRFAIPWFANEGCEEIQVRQRPDRRRLPWGLGWLQRYGRDVEVERGGVAPPSLYLRSPLLSGLYSRPDCPREDTLVEETCAAVALVSDDDAAMTIEVPLPQLDARSARHLRDIIRAALEEGETVVLATADDKEFELMPGSVRQVDASACIVEE